jgi:hypothetical protein
LVATAAEGSAVTVGQSKSGRTDAAPPVEFGRTGATVAAVHPIEWLRAVARSGDVPQTELAGEAAAALSAMSDDPNGLLLSVRRLIDRHPTAGVLWWTCARLLSSNDVGREAAALRRDLDADQVGLSLALDLPDDATVTVIGWSGMADELAGRRGDVRILAVADDPAGGRGGSRGRGGPGGGRGNFGLGLRGAAGRHGFDLDLDDDDLDDDEDSVVVVPAPGLGAAVVASDIVLVDVWAAGSSRFVAAPGTLAAVATARLTGTTVWLTLGVGRRLPDPLFAALHRRACSDEAEPWLAGVDSLDLAADDKVVEPLGVPCPCPPELLRLG